MPCATGVSPIRPQLIAATIVRGPHAWRALSSESRTPWRTRRRYATARAAREVGHGGPRQHFSRQTGVAPRSGHAGRLARAHCGAHDGPIDAVHLGPTPLD